MLTTALSLFAATSLHTPVSSPAAANLNEPFNLTASAYPEKKVHTIAPILEAEAILSLDLETGHTLYQKNAREKRAMASLTKLMTILIILEENDLDEIVTVQNEATQVEPGKIYLYRDEKITVENLLKAALIRSANDAALALAYHNSGSEEAFVEKMNKKAKELGMYNTSFENPIGFDHENQYSTAYDLSILARFVMKKDFVRDNAPIQETEVKSTDQKLTHKVVSTNDLLSSYLNVLGLKTGTTDEAGPCLISVVENEQKHTILNIVLASPKRFEESKILSEWVFQSYNWI